MWPKQAVQTLPLEHPEELNEKKKGEGGKEAAVIFLNQIRTLFVCLPKEKKKRRKGKGEKKKREGGGGGRNDLAPRPTSSLHCLRGRNLRGGREKGRGKKRKERREGMDFTRSSSKESAGILFHA